MRRTIIHFIAIFSIMLMIPSAYAETAEKNIENKMVLYAHPDAKSAVVISISSNQPIIPIFSQGEWIKVADPRTGNVGWVRKDTLKNLGVPYIKTETQTIKSPGVTGYKMSQSFGSSTTIDDEETDRLLKQRQAQGKAIQKAFGEMLKQNAIQLDNLAQQMDDLASQLQGSGFQMPIIVPVFQPVLFMPPDASYSKASHGADAPSNITK